MSSSPVILPPSSLGEAVRPIGSLSDVEFAEIVKVISGPRGFYPTKEQFADLEKSSPNLVINLGFMLAALSYLTSQAERFEQAGKSFDSILSSVIDELDQDAKWEDKKEVASRRLKEIFDKREAFKRFKKLNRLQTGFLPNAVGFSTFVDIRPDFDLKPRKVAGLLPLIQMRITTDASAVAQREMIFQVSEDALKLLKDAIDDIEEKLRALKASDYFSVKRTT
jgi:hypothetical protein